MYGLDMFRIKANKMSCNLRTYVRRNESDKNDKEQSKTTKIMYLYFEWMLLRRNFFGRKYFAKYYLAQHFFRRTLFAKTSFSQLLNFFFILFNLFTYADDLKIFRFIVFNCPIKWNTTFERNQMFCHFESLCNAWIYHSNIE